MPIYTTDDERKIIRIKIKYIDKNRIRNFLKTIMNMRKLFTMGFAAAALLLGSCAQNEVMESPAEQKAIGFTTLNDRVTANTRAANDAKSPYGVFAVRSNATSVWFMNNLKVTTGQDDKDTYGPAYYWPTGGATVDFYAYAPYKESQTHIVLNNNTAPTSGSPLSITYTVPGGAQEDFTVATPKTGMNYDSDTQNKGNVPFIFSHMLSKITVDAKLKDELGGTNGAGYTMTFTSAELKVSSNQGTVDLTTGTPPALSTEGTPATYSGTKSYMFMPQASWVSGQATKVSLQLIGVTIKHNGADYWTGNMKVYNISEDDLTDNTFLAGKHYKITFTIGAKAADGSDNPVFGEAITFSSSVAAWNTDAGNDVDVDQPEVTIP